MSLLGGKISGGSVPFRGSAMLFALACSHPFRLVRCILNKRVQLLCGTISQSRVKMCRRAFLHLVMARNGNRKLLSQRYADYVGFASFHESREREKREREKEGGREGERKFVCKDDSLASTRRDFSMLFSLNSDLPPSLSLKYTSSLSKILIYY